MFEYFTYTIYTNKTSKSIIQACLFIYLFIYLFESGNIHIFLFRKMCDSRYSLHKSNKNYVITFPIMDSIKCRTYISEQYVKNHAKQIA